MGANFKLVAWSTLTIHCGFCSGCARTAVIRMELHLNLTTQTHSASMMELICNEHFWFVNLFIYRAIRFIPLLQNNVASSTVPVLSNANLEDLDRTLIMVPPTAEKKIVSALPDHLTDSY